MRTLIGMVAILVLTGFAGTAPAQEKIEAKQLIGKWQPTEPLKGGVDVTIEFADKGKMSFHVEVGGKTEKLDGTYKLDGDKLDMAITIAGKEQKETFTLTKLSAEELIGKTKDGKEERYRKVKGK